MKKDSPEEPKESKESISLQVLRLMKNNGVETVGIDWVIELIEED